MGISTDGQICYGISFEEGYEFPWGEKEAEEWWLYDVCKYKNPFELYDNGDYVGGAKPSEEKISEYYDAKEKAKEANPMPFEEVVHCSYDYPMYILAVPGTHIKAYRRCPEEISLVIDPGKLQKFLDFCKNYGINGECKWWLSSLYG